MKQLCLIYRHAAAIRTFWLKYSFTAATVKQPNLVKRLVYCAEDMRRMEQRQHLICNKFRWWSCQFSCTQFAACVASALLNRNFFLPEQHFFVVKPLWTKLLNNNVTQIVTRNLLQASNTSWCVKSASFADQRLINQKSPAKWILKASIVSHYRLFLLASEWKREISNLMRKTLFLNPKKTAILSTWEASPNR